MFTHILEGWETQKDKQRRERDRQARLAQQRIDSQLRRQDEEDKPRNRLNQRILNNSAITARALGGQVSEEPERDVGAVGLGLTLRQNQQRRDYEHARRWIPDDVARNLLVQRGLPNPSPEDIRGLKESLSKQGGYSGFRDAWELTQTYGEATSLAGGRLTKPFTAGTRQVVRETASGVADITRGRFGEAGMHFLRTGPYGVVSRTGETGRGFADYEKSPEDFKLGVESVLGDEDAKAEVRERLTEIGLTDQIVGGAILDLTNLLPGIGFTKVDDVARAFNAIRKGKTAILESPEAMRLVRGLRRLATEEAGAVRFAKMPDDEVNAIRKALGAPDNAKVVNMPDGFRITQWYDRDAKTWVTHLTDKKGNKLAEPLTGAKDTLKQNFDAMWAKSDDLGAAAPSTMGAAEEVTEVDFKTAQRVLADLAQGNASTEANASARALFEAEMKRTGLSAQDLFNMVREKPGKPYRFIKGAFSQAEQAAEQAPRHVYHGTTEAYKGLPAKGEGYLGPGVYVSESPEVASQFGMRGREALPGARVFPMELAADARVLNVDSAARASAEDIAAVRRTFTQRGAKATFDKLLEENNGHLYETIIKTDRVMLESPTKGLPTSGERAAANRRLAKAGFDALHSVTEGGQYAVLNPKKLTSAIPEPSAFSTIDDALPPSAAREVAEAAEEPSRALVVRAETGWDSNTMRYRTNPTVDDLVETTAESKLRAEITGSDEAINAHKRGEAALQAHSEVQALKKAEDDLKLIIRNETDPAARGRALEELKAIREKMDRVRAEARGAASMIDPEATVTERWMAEAFTKPSGLGHIWEYMSTRPILSAITSRINRSYLYASRSVGHILMAGRVGSTELMTELHSTIMPRLRQYGMPFEVTKGMELRTGKPLLDLIENWQEERKLFLAHPNLEAMDNYMAAYQDARKWGLAKLKEMGYNTPEAWQEYDHAFRQVVGVEGIDVKDAIQRGLANAAKKPGSFKHRVYETVANGMHEGRKYAQHPDQALQDALEGMIEYGVRRWSIDQIKRTVGTRAVALVNKTFGEARNVAAHERDWVRRVLDFAVDSRHAQPPKPRFRTTASGLEVSNDLKAKVAQIDEIVRTSRGNVRTDRLKPIIEELETLLAEKQAAHKAAQKAFIAERDKALASVALAKNQLPEAAIAKAKTIKVGPYAGEYAVQPGPLTVPELNRVLFTTEDAKFLAENFTPRFQDVKGALTTWERYVGNSVRMIQTGVDQGWHFLHGLGAMALDLQAIRRSPVRALQPWKSVWVRSTVEGTIAMFNPRLAAQRISNQMAKNPELAASYRRYVGKWNTAESGVEEVEALGQAGIVGRIPIIGGIPKALSRGMASFLNYAMWEAWKAMAPFAKTVDGQMALGAHIRNMMGSFSFERAGIGSMQRLVERSALLYSASFTRSSFALIANAANPLSKEGRLAWEGLASLTAVGVGLVSAMTILNSEVAKGNLDPRNWKWKDIGRQDLQSINPYGGQFMSIPVGENYIGIGGATRSNIKWIAQTGRQAKETKGESLNPYDPETVFNFDHPLVKLQRQKGTWASSVTMNLITGEDYLGNQLTPAEALFGGAEDAGPFWASAYMQAEGSVTDRITASAATYIGLNTFPKSPFDKMNDSADEAFQGLDYKEALEEMPNYVQEVKLGMHNDDPSAKAFYDNWHAYQDDLRDKGNLKQELRDGKDAFLRDTAVPTLRTAAEGVRWNVPGSGERFAEAVPVVAQLKMNETDRLTEELGVEFKDAEDESESAYDQWLALDPLDFGSIDDPQTWKTFKKERAKLEAQMLPQEREALNNPARKWPDPLVSETEARRVQAIKDRDKWFDTPKYVGTTVEQSAQIDELFAEVSELRTSDPRMAKRDARWLINRASRLNPGKYTNEVVHAAFMLTRPRYRDMLVSPKRDQWLLSHPDLIVFNEWMLDTLSDDQQMEMLSVLRSNR